MMLNMKNLKTIISSAIATFMFSGVVRAQSNPPPGSVTNSTGITSLQQILNIVYSLAFWFQAFFFAIAIIYIILAAIAYLQSGGDVEKVTEAKNKLVYAIVAIAIAVLAFAMRSIVANFLGGSGSQFCIFGFCF